MKMRIRPFIAAGVPFILTIALWRLNAPLWNPGGILAMIPIFYYSFVRPTPWFPAYAAIMCFLIDYQSDTVLYWTALYAALYAANGFQNVIDLTRWDGYGVRAFALFMGAALTVLFFSNVSMANAVRMVWTGVWVCLLYPPIIALTGGRK